MPWWAFFRLFGESFFFVLRDVLSLEKGVSNAACTLDSEQRAKWLDHFLTSTGFVQSNSNGFEPRRAHRSKDVDGEIYVCAGIYDRG